MQHGVPRILKLMRRGRPIEPSAHRKMAADLSELTIRSTFICGFPGETDAEFEALLQFLTDADLDRVGCFAYSDVDGAAANELPDAVPETVKQERLERLMLHQAQISTRRLAAKVGRRMEVLIDSVDADGAIGRSLGDAPEIDGCVYVDSTDCGPGDLIDVTIVEADTHDLFATTAVD
jgi:ribosomal protein S12 methylthiotransferase